MGASVINNILIVDDDEVFRNTLKRSFELRKLKASAAGSAREAIQVFREEKPELVVLDYRMPERDGLSVLREMESLNRKAVLILLTGFGSIPLAVEAMQEGADTVLTKPCDAEEILNHANNLFEKKRRDVPGLDRQKQKAYKLDILEREGIENALKATCGNVSKAALLLGINRRTLQRKMKRFFVFFLTFVGATSFLSSALADTKMKDEGKRTQLEKLINITGDDEYRDEGAAWDKTYARKDYVFGKEPAKFLHQHINELPKGRALDIAMGEGRNAVFLAKKGFYVEGVDISAVALRKAQALAAENGVKIHTVNANLQNYQIKPDHYNVIINFYFLERTLFPQIKAGLKKGGIVMFETNTMDQLKKGGAWQKDYLLRTNELKEAFKDFEILHYAETDDGENAIASLIARKPK